MSIYIDALESFRERFSDILEDDILKEGAELPKYWQDDIADLADGLVPIYTPDVVREWTEAGYPDVDDSGLTEGITDIIQIMKVALYELYSQELYGLAQEAGFDN